MINIFFIVVGKGMFIQDGETFNYTTYSFKVILKNVYSFLPSFWVVAAIFSFLCYKNLRMFELMLHEIFNG